MSVKYVKSTGAALFVSSNVLFIKNACLLTRSRASDFEATSRVGKASS